MNLSGDRQSLQHLLTTRSLTFGEVQLASGEKSGVYVDCKLTTYFPDAIPLVGRLFLEEIRRQGWQPAAAGGLTLGADPIAFAVARESADAPPPVAAFVVRKAAKEHGKQKFIEGLHRTEGVPVVVIDDVCTKGGSTAQALEKVLESGMKVLGAICLVDRQQGATELLASKYGCALASIFKLRELVEYYETELRGAHA